MATDPANREVVVLLLEDDAMVRAWVRETLEGTEFHVIGEAPTVAATRALIEQRPPGLLLLDQRLPDGLGTELLRELRREGVATPALVLTANVEAGLNEAARAAGAQGTALKSADRSALLVKLRSVVAGEEAFDSQHPRRSGNEWALSPREREVLSLVAEGATNRQIGERLNIGEETVKTLLERVYLKLGVGRRAEAVSVAMTRGLL